ncbi:MAG: FtsX-like permease family protein [Peptococcaceae bacterium]|nr:FtsX-like permease family protein [Peptococcaceae bacterium]
MLANNNRRIIYRLAQGILRREWKQTLILFLAIALAAFLLFSVLTTGLSYLELSRLQDTRMYGAERDLIIASGFDEEQYQQLLADERIESVGQEAYAGFIRSTEADETVSVGLIWDDETLWNVQRANVVTAQEGHYPEAFNELMVSREALAQCGLPDLGVGDRFTATVETNAGIFTQEFVISGIWEGYGDTAPIYVSQDFFERSGYSLAESGILNVKLAHDYVLPGTINDLEAGLNLDTQQVFQPSSYIENSWKVLLGVIGLGLVIILSAYLLIYNILYLSVANKSRYYGLLQSLGMTPCQLGQLVRRQMVGIAGIGLVVGLIAGVLTTLFALPRLMFRLGITEDLVAIHFQPLVFVLTILAVVVAVLAGLRTPLRMAQQNTPLEVLKMRPMSTYRAHLGKGCQLPWRLAMAELGRDRKKTLIVLLSLALSLSVFVCLTTIVSSLDERTVVPLYWDADMVIRNDSGTTEDCESWKPLLEDLRTALAACDGVADVHAVEGIPFTIADDAFAAAWLESYAQSRPYLTYDEVMADYTANPTHYYGMMKAIDAAEFEHLNAQLAEPLDKQAFLDGAICFVNISGGIALPERYLEGVPLTIEVAGQRLKMHIVAESSNDSSLSASRNLGPNIIVSQEWLAQQHLSPLTLGLTVHYEVPGDAATEERVQRLLAENGGLDDIFYQSHYEEVLAIQATEGDLNETGAAISLLLLLVGGLNYVNTMAASIQSRRLKFSIMESLGMTPPQLRCQLVIEGLLIALGVLMLTATLGMMVTYLAFQVMNYANVPFQVPFAPIVGAALLVTLLCVVVPLACYRRLGDEGALIERLRISE